LKIFLNIVVKIKGNFMRVPKSFKMHGFAYLLWTIFVFNDKGGSASCEMHDLYIYGKKK
jgi:hypothetical protein